MSKKADSLLLSKAQWSRLLGADADDALAWLRFYSMRTRWP